MTISRQKHILLTWGPSEDRRLRSAAWFLQDNVGARRIVPLDRRNQVSTDTWSIIFSCISNERRGRLGLRRQGTEDLFALRGSTKALIALIPRLSDRSHPPVLSSGGPVVSRVCCYWISSIRFKLQLPAYGGVKRGPNGSHGRTSWYDLRQDSSGRRS